MQGLEHRFFRRFAEITCDGLCTMRGRSQEFIVTKEAINPTTSAHQAWWYSKFVRVQMSEQYN